MSAEKGTILKSFCPNTYTVIFNGRRVLQLYRKLIYCDHCKMVNLSEFDEEYLNHTVYYQISMSETIINECRMCPGCNFRVGGIVKLYCIECQTAYGNGARCNCPRTSIN